MFKIQESNKKNKPLNPKSLPFFNRSFDKKRLKLLFSWYYANKGESAAFSLVEILQKLGFTYAMKAGISLGVDDLKVPSSKSESLTEAVDSLNKTKAAVNNGNVTALEEFQQFVDTWHRTSENLKTAVVQNFTRNYKNVKKSNFATVSSDSSKIHSIFSNTDLQKNYQISHWKKNNFGWPAGLDLWSGPRPEKTVSQFSEQTFLSSKSNARSESLLNPKMSYGNTLNPVYMMAFSGARGNLSQVRQLVGMRGLMADPQGQLVEFPIQSNFREGLTVTEYMISCYGARKGLVDTALRTAAAGYLTRRLVDVSHHQIVRSITCGTKNGICFPLHFKNKKQQDRDTLLPSAWKVEPISLNKRKNHQRDGLSDDSSWDLGFHSSSQAQKAKNIKDPATTFSSNSSYSDITSKPKAPNLTVFEKKQTVISNKQLKTPLRVCIGRVLARDIPGIAFRNQEIDISLGSSPNLRQIYETIGIYVRSPLTCRAETGICQLCYGWSVSANRLVGLGEAVGIIAAQSIGEPGTQLTMRTFHTGGVFSGDIMEECRAKHGGIVNFAGAFLGLMVRTSGGAIAFCMKTAGQFSIENRENHTTYNLLPNTLLFVRQGEKVVSGALLAQIPNLPEIEENAGEATKTIASNLSGEIRQTKTFNLELESISILAGQSYVPLYVHDFGLTCEKILPKTSFELATTIKDGTSHGFSRALDQRSYSFDPAKTQGALVMEAQRARVVGPLTKTAGLRPRGPWPQDQRSETFGLSPVAKTAGLRPETILPQDQTLIPNGLAKGSLVKTKVANIKKFKEISAKFSFSSQTQTRDSIKILPVKNKVLLISGSHKLGEGLKMSKFGLQKPLLSFRPVLDPLPLKFASKEPWTSGLDLRSWPKGNGPMDSDPSGHGPADQAKGVRSKVSGPGGLSKATLFKEQKLRPSGPGSDFFSLPFFDLTNPSPQPFASKEAFLAKTKQVKYRPLSKKILIKLRSFSYLKLHHNAVFIHNSKKASNLFEQTQESMASLREITVSKSLKSPFKKIQNIAKNLPNPTVLKNIDVDQNQTLMNVEKQGLSQRITKLKSTTLLNCLLWWPATGLINKESWSWSRTAQTKFDLVFLEIAIYTSKLIFDFLKIIELNKYAYLFWNLGTVEFIQSYKLNNKNYQIPEKEAFKLKGPNRRLSPEGHRPAVLTTGERPKVSDQRSRPALANGYRPKVSGQIKRIPFGGSSLEQVQRDRANNTSAQTYKTLKITINPGWWGKQEQFTFFKCLKNNYKGDKANLYRDLILQKQYLGCWPLQPFGPDRRSRPSVLAKGLGSFKRPKSQQAIGYDPLTFDKKKFSLWSLSKRSNNLFTGNALDFAAKRSWPLGYTAFFAKNFNTKINLEKNIKQFSIILNKINSRFNIKNSENPESTFLELIKSPSKKKIGEFFPVQGAINLKDFKKFYGAWHVPNKSNIILTHSDRVSYKLLTKKSIINLENKLKPTSFGPQVGSFVNIGDQLINDHGSSYSGQIIEKSAFLLTLRFTQNILYSNLKFRPAQVSKNVKSGNWLNKGTSLVTLPYISSVTGDIVAGIPKIEQLFEARGETLDETIEKIWSTYQVAYIPKAKAVRECFKEIGLFVVAAIQSVYSSQGVNIADKHLEVIIRQMTRRAVITDPGDTEFLSDEFVDLQTIECVNWSTYGASASYRPRLIGITKSSLTSNSFLSSASFQQTSRVLERETVLEKTDRLLGLKERVMMGALIDAGTGGFETDVFLSKINKKPLSALFFKKLKLFSRKKIEQIREKTF